MTEAKSVKINYLVTFELSDYELLQYGNQVACIDKELDQLGVDLDLAKKSYKKQVSELTNERKRLQDAILSRSEKRKVECHKMIDYIQNKVEIIHNGEIIEERALRDCERQMEIDGDEETDIIDMSTH